MDVHPTDDELAKLSHVLVGFGLRGGKGAKKGDQVTVDLSTSALAMAPHLLDAILSADAHPLIIPNLTDLDERFLTHASVDQLRFVHKQYLRGLSAQTTQWIMIRDPPRIQPQASSHRSSMYFQARRGEFLQMREKNTKRHGLNWTITYYPAQHGADAAGISMQEYWGVMRNALAIDTADPIRYWKDLQQRVHAELRALNKLHVTELRVTAKDTDLTLLLGDRRQWLGIDGCNIPSYERFVVPDYRGTNGTISFSEPLYVNGDRIEGVELTFRNGKVVEHYARSGKNTLGALLTQRGCRAVGEFSLTDAADSPINTFMANTLYDENRGGSGEGNNQRRQGNTHIALGSGIAESIRGWRSLSANELLRLGVNDAIDHVDIISTTPRTVEAKLANGRFKTIYRDGHFTLQ